MCPALSSLFVPSSPPSIGPPSHHLPLRSSRPPSFHPFFPPTIRPSLPPTVRSLLSTPLLPLPPSHSPSPPSVRPSLPPTVRPLHPSVTPSHSPSPPRQPPRLDTSRTASSEAFIPEKSIQTHESRKSINVPLPRITHSFRTFYTNQRFISIITTEHSTTRPLLPFRPNSVSFPVNCSPVCYGRKGTRGALAGALLLRLASQNETEVKRRELVASAHVELALEFDPKQEKHQSKPTRHTPPPILLLVRGVARTSVQDPLLKKRPPLKWGSLRGWWSFIGWAGVTKWRHRGGGGGPPALYYFVTRPCSLQKY